MSFSHRSGWVRLAAAAGWLAVCAGAGFAQPPGAAGPPPPAISAPKIQKPAALRLYELQRKEAEELQGARTLVLGLLRGLSPGEAQGKIKDGLMALDEKLALVNEALLSANELVIGEYPEILQENAKAASEANKKRLGMNRELIAADRLASAGKLKEGLEALAAMEAKYGTDVEEITIRKTVWNARTGGSEAANQTLEMVKAVGAANVLEETGTQDNYKLAIEKWKRVRELNPSGAAEADRRIKLLEAKLKP